MRSFKSGLNAVHWPSNKLPLMEPFHYCGEKVWTVCPPYLNPRQSLVWCPRLNTTVVSNKETDTVIYRGTAEERRVGSKTPHFPFSWRWRSDEEEVVSKGEAGDRIWKTSRVTCETEGYCLSGLQDQNGVRQRRENPEERQTIKNRAGDWEIL